MPRLFIDVSDLVDYARDNSSLSGIQRVSIEVIRRYANSISARNVKLIRFDPRTGDLSYHDIDFFSGAYRFDHREFCRYFGVSGSDGSVDLNDYLRRRYRSSGLRRVHRVRNIALNLLSGGSRFRQRRISWRLTGALPLPGRVEAGPRAGDTIFIPGATWGMTAYIERLEGLRADGVGVVQFIHDLIPLATPEHVGDYVPRKFFDWLQTMSGIVDVYLANSEATRRDLIAFIDKSGAARRPCHVIPLAHEFPSRPPKPDRGTALSKPEVVFLSKRDVPEEVHARTLNASRFPFVLCVGTIESRKNVYALARVWMEIHKRLGFGAPRLILAGKSGSQKEDFDDLMRGSGCCDGMIAIVERPSDADLAYLYKSCLFSVCVSVYEGWGLPIGESLWFGKTVVSSFTSSMPEVGGDMVAYVDPHDPQDMLDGILRMISDEPYRASFEQRIRRDRLRTWDMVADDIMTALGRVTAI
ncbi:Glycosyltransferase involved in cell wall bisynthesis [Kaistia soli DSM 19436]|uniref:Glycosyltransferase involved in cell wall bisynthesis n=1 Tax=Kaistia soli DSM 19436 TaxID=1122133 RepID=A0A1M5CGT6_9HYPH|nr:glycosyltransferase family 1 protein [Kaistia soli]SHF53602.1 Glycosyltransferase involved in cell wall bisynthesis [Kaistia soli DSM 19436]